MQSQFTTTGPLLVGAIKPSFRHFRGIGRINEELLNEPVLRYFEAFKNTKKHIGKANFREKNQSFILDGYFFIFSELSYELQVKLSLVYQLVRGLNILIPHDVDTHNKGQGKECFPSHIIHYFLDSFYL